MNTELRERAILPILIPLVAIVLTEIVVFSMAQVLLATGGTPAVVIGAGAALAILVGAAFIAARPRIRTSTIVGLLVVVGVGAVAAGGYAMSQGPFYEREAAAERPTVEISADDLVFDTDTLELASTGTVIEFHNADSQPHNVAIFDGDDATAPVLFRGEIIGGSESVTYEVDEIPPGEYHFHCDVHPNMVGTAVVGEAPDAGAH